MNSNQEEKVLFKIYEEIIQEEAECVLDRFLTTEELEQVEEEIREHLCELIQDAIHSVIDYNKLIQRNKDAEKSFPHFKLYWLCHGTGETDYRLEHIFRLKEDIKQYKQMIFTFAGDEWKLVTVNSPEDIIEEKIEL